MPKKIPRKRFGAIHPWLKLLRLPNLFTVPGDAMAGAALAAAMTGTRPPLYRLLLAGSAVIFLYSYGLILNDMTDLQKDRRQRPDRPLPRGSISPDIAAAAASVCAATGLLLALAGGGRAFAAGLLLVALITAYDLFKDSVAGFAEPAMGLCRAFSFLLGAGMTGWHGALVIPAAGLGVYVAAVTAVAKKENRPHRFGRIAAVPLWTLAIMLPATAVAVAGSLSLRRLLVSAIVFAPAILVCYRRQHRLRSSRTQPQFIRSSIGEYLRALMFVQAGLLILSGSGVAALTGVLLILLWPAAAVTSRRFYAS